MSTIKLLQFLQQDCPEPLREQILDMMQREWPQAIEGTRRERPWPENPEAQPTSFVLLEDNSVVSHVAVPRKDIKHEGQTYRAFGLSEVMTHPSFRHQGFGLQLVKEATTFISNNEPDIALFTCQPPLVSFYTQGGYEHIPNTPLVGGTRNKPFRSDSLGLSTMIHFFSEKAQQNRSAFVGADIYLELGENMLW